MKKVLVVWYKNFEYLESIKNAFLQNGVCAGTFTIEYFSDYANWFERFINSLGIKYFVEQHGRKMREELIKICEKENFEDIIIITGNFTNVLDEVFFTWANKTGRKMQLWFVDSVRGSTCYSKNYFTHFEKIYSFEPLDIKYLLDQYGADNVQYLPLVASQEKYMDQNICNKLYDVCFVGVGGEKRNDILESIAEYCFLNNKKMIVYGNFWKFRPTIHRIRHEYKFKKRYPYLSKFVHNKFICPEKVAELYNNSRICLNIVHSVHSTYTAANPRTFEIMATNSFQLIDYNPTVAKLFTNGEHLAMYKDKKEAVELVQYYLEHEEERVKVARTGFLEVQDKFLLKDIVKTFMR